MTKNCRFDHKRRVRKKLVESHFFSSPTMAYIMAYQCSVYIIFGPIEPLVIEKSHLGLVDTMESYLLSKNAKDRAKMTNTCIAELSKNTHFCFEV